MIEVPPKHVVDTYELAQKTLKDICFLESRIKRLKSLQTPNLSMLNNYESMLTTRKSVLVWLEQQGSSQNLDSTHMKINESLAQPIEPESNRP